MTERGEKGKSMEEVAKALKVVSSVIEFYEGTPPGQNQRELDMLLGVEDALLFVLKRGGTALDSLVKRGSDEYRHYLEDLARKGNPSNSEG